MRKKTDKEQIIQYWKDKYFVSLDKRQKTIDDWARFSIFWCIIFFVVGIIFGYLMD